jgi:hypothetical protein
MGESQDVWALTDEERHLIRLLRHSPQPVTMVAEALYIIPEQAQDVLQRLDRKVGLVRLFRYDTLRYKLPE